MTLLYVQRDIMKSKTAIEIKIRKLRKELKNSGWNYEDEDIAKAEIVQLEWVLE